ncbi:hypothetical protein TgHK011_008997 [Trichoderma gracile]|nr:hypothetical protein TgHK011_008997 [Trichoderma gracile]
MSDPSASSTEKKSLVVHLQVWHYRASEGRSIEANNAFADLFRGTAADWDVVQTEFHAVAGLNSHDRYVPVEVRFRHKALEYDHPGEAAMAAVRRLFFKTAPQFVYQFCIENRSTPHNLNIFPVDVPKSFKERYTHVYGLNPLNIRINTFVLPERMRTAEGEDEVQKWLRAAGNDNTADDVLGTLAAAVSLYLIYLRRRGAEKGRVIGQADAQIILANEYISNVYLPEGLPELQALLRKVRVTDNHAAQPEAPAVSMQVAMRGAGQLLTEYERLADLVKSRSKRLEEDRVLSCQDLHELVQDAHTVTLHVSRLNQAVRPVIRLLEESYKDVMADAKRYTDAVGIVGYIGLTLRYMTGRSTEDDARYRMWVARGAEATQKKMRVRDFDIEMKKLARDVHQAQGAISEVFCAQVMNLQLDDALPEHERRRVLATLGVDMEAVPDPVYSQELIRHRTGTFLSQDGILRDSMEQVLKDMSLVRDRGQGSALGSDEAGRATSLPTLTSRHTAPGMRDLGLVGTAKLLEHTKRTSVYESGQRLNLHYHPSYEAKAWMQQPAASQQVSRSFEARDSFALITAIVAIITIPIPRPSINTNITIQTLHHNNERPPARPSPLTKSATFLVLTITTPPSPSSLKTIRSALASIDDLSKNVSIRDLNSNFSCTVGIGSAAWDLLVTPSSNLPKPAELHPFRPVHGQRHSAPATPGDLLFHIRSDRRDICFEFESQLLRLLGDAVAVEDDTQGFRYFDARDLLGFVDGTANPSASALPDAVLITEQDDHASCAGGSYVVVQKYIHDMPAWRALSTSDQEAVIGRTKADNVELDDQAPGAQQPHKTLTTIEDEHGNEHGILRDNMPFGSPGSGVFGTYFIGYSRRLWVVEKMMEHGHIKDGIFYLPYRENHTLPYSSPAAAVLRQLHFVGPPPAAMSSSTPLA